MHILHSFFSSIYELSYFISRTTFLDTPYYLPAEKKDTPYYLSYKLEVYILHTPYTLLYIPSLAQNKESRGESEIRGGSTKPSRNARTPNFIKGKGASQLQKANEQPRPAPSLVFSPARS